MDRAAIAIASPLPASVELVELAARGDIDAFERLVAAGSDRTYRLALAVLGNEADAHDATQDSYVRAWRELPRLRQPAKFDAWLYRIVINACRARLRNQRRVREISFDANPFERHQPGPAVADTVADSELIERAFDRLDANRRAILVLHYLQNESVSSIAAVLGIAPGTVKWRLSDARAALARALTAEGETRP
jgi:RNA polymerase sigma-70 factor (ECF subfamily)